MATACGKIIECAAQGRSLFIFVDGEVRNVPALKSGISIFCIGKHVLNLLYPKSDCIT